MENQIKAKILIVEDIPQGVNILPMFLIKHGFKVSIARNGEEAIKRAQEIQPDIILMDGWEATKIIRATEGISRTPIICVTALNSLQKEELSKAGFDDIEVKPINYDNLLEK